MAQNVGRYRELTIETKKLITSSGKQWMNYLETASWNYKYSFAEQVLIFAQRPGATACADFQTWNRQLNRSIRNGAKGIGLLVDVIGQAKIRYVFDIPDTRSRYNSQDIKLWEINNSNITQVAKSLESDSYEADLFSRIVSVSERMADEYWENYKEDILSSLDNSLMEEYDPFIQKELFCNLVASSVQYATLFRCGLQPQRYFSADDFPVYEWRTDNTVSILGEAVSQLSNRLLRQIERTVKSHERRQQMERSQQHGEQFAGSNPVQTGGQLSRSGHETSPSVRQTAGQVRLDETAVSDGASTDYIQPDAPDGRIMAASPRSGRGGEQPAGAADAGAGKSGRRDGAAEGRGHDEVGRTDEQHPGTGGGDHLRGTDLQLSLFPTEGEQIQMIEKAENVKASSAFSFAQTDIDHVLRLGGNAERQRECIVAAFEKQKSNAEIAAYLQTLCTGGSGVGYPIPLTRQNGTSPQKPVSPITIRPLTSPMEPNVPAPTGCWRRL